MRKYFWKHRVRLLGIGAVFAAMAVTLLTLYAVPGDPPLGDCFGGALSQDPPHCYALEQAHRQGVIDVEKVYDANRILYLSLRQDEPVEEHVHEFLEAKSYEFYDRWPDEVPVNPWYDDCVNVPFETHLSRVLSRVGHPAEVDGVCGHHVPHRWRDDTPAGAGLGVVAAGLAGRCGDKIGA